LRNSEESFGGAAAAAEEADAVVESRRAAENAMGLVRVLWLKFRGPPARDGELSPLEKQYSEEGNTKARFRYFFFKMGTVAFSLLFGKYCPIMV
jgi:hypothetical protein